MAVKKYGMVAKTLLRLTSVIQFQTEGKPYGSAVAVSAGLFLAQATEGTLKTWSIQERLRKFNKEYEERRQVCEAKAREMGVSGAEFELPTGTGN